MFHHKYFPAYFTYNVGKVPHWYGVQGSDTTMLTKASWPEQQKIKLLN